MSLFEFLMILLSLIVGLGLAEILSGIGRVLKSDGIHAFSWTHSAIVATIFIGLLQTFWESWGLGDIAEWSFPAMLLMLGSPTLLFLIAHILFPDAGQSQDLDAYYFERARLLWVLAAVTVVIGTLFRPVAFGMDLWAPDNASAIPTLAVCTILATVRRPIVHRILVPLVLIVVLLDTLTISYSISSS